MKDTEQTTERKGISFLPGEMHQAFIDWVNKLPFMKRGTSRNVGQGHRAEKSTNQASATQPAEGGAAGRPLDKEEEPR